MPRTRLSRPAACIEPLEPRELMAVVVTVTKKDKLTITAPPGDTAGDVVEVLPTNGVRDIEVFVNNVPAVLRPNADQPFTVTKSRIKRIVADMGAGDDEVYIGTRKGTPRPFKNQLTTKSTLVGGDGNDILYGDRGKDLIFGGSGNDQIFAENGRDNVVGQDGNDFLHGGGAQDAVYGMAGADAVFGDEDLDFVNAGGDPGDTHDRNERPTGGETSNVNEYVRKLILLAVPDEFQADARA